MLARWADLATAADETQLRTFVEEAAEAGDPDVALGKFLELARSGADVSMEGQLAEQLVDVFGMPALAAIRPFLSSEVLIRRPLFAAELSLSEGNRELGRWYLNRTDLSRLAPEKLTTWLALEHQVEMDADAVRRLAALWIAGRLPKALAPRLADEAAKLGQPAMHDLIWSSLGR